ncbi:MAG: RNA polymerase sigma factor [Streptosporangiaceae bacterium]
MNDVPSVTDLVTRAMHGDEQAWDALVERYAPLVWSICRRYRLSDADVHDVSQSVWLGLVNHLGKLRDPGALPGWLATTTRRQCGKARHAAQAAGNVLDTGDIPDEQARMAEQELLVAERHATLREAVTRLSPNCQRLIAILIEDPPVPYAQISARLGIPVGSIGPCRGRCLDKLRRNPAIAALIDADTDPAAGQGGRRVGRLPDDRALRRMDRQPPRSSARPQSQ